MPCWAPQPGCSSQVTVQPHASLTVLDTHTTPRWGGHTHPHTDLTSSAPHTALSFLVTDHAALLPVTPTPTQSTPSTAGPDPLRCRNKHPETPPLACPQPVPHFPPVHLPDLHLQRRTHSQADGPGRTLPPSERAHAGAYAHPLPAEAPLPVWPCTAPPHQPRWYSWPSPAGRGSHLSPLDIAIHKHMQPHQSWQPAAATGWKRTAGPGPPSSTLGAQRQRTRQQRACSSEGRPGRGREARPELPGSHWTLSPAASRDRTAPQVAHYTCTHTYLHPEDTRTARTHQNFTLPQTHLCTQPQMGCTQRPTEPRRKGPPQHAGANVPGNTAQTQVNTPTETHWPPCTVDRLTRTRGLRCTRPDHPAHGYRGPDGLTRHNTHALSMSPHMGNQCQPPPTIHVTTPAHPHGSSGHFPAMCLRPRPHPPCTHALADHSAGPRPSSFLPPSPRCSWGPAASPRPAPAQRL